MAQEPGLRERKKKQTADRIETAALDLFEEHGFDATTIDDIATAADISSRTFFHYFPTKEDVVLGDYAARLSRVTESLKEQPADSPPWKALGVAFADVAHDYEVQHDQLRRRFQIMMTTGPVFARNLQLQAGWEDAVAEALEERMGLESNHILPRLMAASALGAMRSSVRNWLPTTDQSLPNLVQECFTQLESGFKPDL